MPSYNGIAQSMLSEVETPVINTKKNGIKITLIFFNNENACPLKSCFFIGIRNAI